MTDHNEEMDISNEDNIDNDSTTSESSQDEIEDNEQEVKLIELRKRIENNLYNYQDHIDYINLSRQYGNLEHLRFARRTMSEIFPLTEQLWLDWIRDEKQLLISNIEENKEINQLFERAIQDYLSVMIWIEYIEYRIPYYVSMNSIDELRNLFERGLSSSCGIHLTDGHLLWAAYIETEKAILDGIILNYNQNKTNIDLKDKILQHVDYILKLYRRQLSIPLREIDKTFKDYNEFCQQYKEYLPLNYVEQYDLIVNNEFERAIQQLKLCEKFEHELEDQKRNVAAYKKYFEFEKEPARIQCLYERAIGKNLKVKNKDDLLKNFIEN